MKLMFNEDWMHFIWTRYERQIPITEEVLKQFVYQYRDTQITDFALNVNGTVSTFPSRTRQDFCQKYLAREENGIAVDYTDTFARKAYEIFVEKNLDMYQIWIDTLCEVGIRPWLSFRVNDCHGNGDMPELRQSEEIMKYPEKWRIRYRKANGYFDRCLDFELPEVRKEFLAYVEEALQRYQNLYGVELDFTRESYLFAPGREKAGEQVLNDLMKEIRQLCSGYAGGRPLKINVLVPATAQTCFDFGLDPVYWAEQGYVDSVVILPRWTTINTAYEIKLWKNLLQSKASLGTGQQLLIKPYPGRGDVISTVDMAFGQACANLYHGSDFVYLYNHMDILESGLDSAYHENCVREAGNMRRILCNVGEYATASLQKRSHVLTFDDYRPIWEKPVSRLPIRLEKGRLECIRIVTGGIGENEAVCLHLGFDRTLTAEALEVYLNGVKLGITGIGGIDGNVTDSIGHIFPVHDTSVIDGSAVIEVKTNCEAVLKYAEIMISGREA